MRTLILLLVLSVAGYFWHSRHEKYGTYEGLKLEAKTKENLANDKEKQLKALQEKIVPLRQGEAEMSKPDGSPEELEKAVLALRDALTAGAAKLESAEDDFLAAVNDVREAGKKETFPLLKLPNGEELKNAHITGFGEGFLKLAHDDGNVKLMADDLPEGWSDKFAVEYVSRHSKADNEALTAKVQQAVLTPLDLKKAKLSEIDERLKAVSDQLMSYSAGIREAHRQADDLIRQAYRISVGGGRNGAAAASQRDALFKKAKELEQGSEGTRLMYVQLRKQKQELEKQKLLIKKMPMSPQPPPAPAP